ncbi:cytochrome b561 and DOMON domain-containing protein At3g25290-like [Trifolium pratense]|uniref:cytochrome b561 and DOMON domain-containing protein At3g25290-like n=1 Tax=Trifolium pratense TaxID=57577 RepID=UPI001E696054|nr:cytochrome b561 and DOMON domain-containing protein At3g25290-like [Trifolium pratense]
MSSTTLITIMILVIFFFANIDVIASEPCTERFTKLIKQRNITKCKTLRTLGAEFGWNYYNITNSTTTLEILFGACFYSRQGWIAWGVNPGKRAEMIGTKAIIGIKSHDFATANSHLTVATYDITKETKGGCSLLPTNDSGLNVSHMVIQNQGSDFYTIYARLVLPSDKYNISRLNHVWQIGNVIDGRPLNHPTTLHNVDSTETIDLTSPRGASMGQYRSFLRTVHGVLNIIGWGTLLPIGVIVPRYFRVYPFKRDPWWFYVHIGCQLTGFLVGTAGWVIGLVIGHSSKYYIFHAHRDFGILIFTFSTIQMLAFRLKPKATDDYRKYWNMYHHFLGYGLLAIIFINIFKGINILHGGESWRWSYIGILICLGAFAFTLEIFTWIKFIMVKWHNHNNNRANQQNKD